MAKNDFSSEEVENYQQKCCCSLVLDVSGSMTGEPLKELNKGLQDFHKDIQEDSTTSSRLEVSVITFGSEVETLIEPSLVENFAMPMLKINGSTRLVDGVREGIKKVEDRKEWYKETGQPYYRPWVILITDGEPDGGQDVGGLAGEIKHAMDNKKFHFFAIGVEGANMDVLKQISSDKMQPGMLQGLKFSAFFKWLSQSMGAVTSSTDGQKIDIPDPTSWMDGFQID
jgi:uncharacterized protein YegL